MREYKLKINNKNFKAELKEITTEHAVVIVNGDEYTVELEDFGMVGGRIAPAARPRPAAPRPSSGQSPSPAALIKDVPRSDESGVPAPLPGLIMEIFVKEGDTIKAGDDLLVMEAMKMENKVQAPFDGTVKKINVQAGANVAEGDILVEIARPLMTTV